MSAAITPTTDRARRATRPRPSEPSRRGEPAGFATRGVAYVIDAMVIVLLMSLGAFALDAVVLLATGTTTGTDLGGMPSGWLMTVLTASCVGLTYLTLGWWLFGRTVGKLAVGVRVVGADGRSPTFLRALVRAVMYSVSAVFGLGFAWVGLRPQRRAWHDYVARTWVVYDWSAHGLTHYDEDPLPPRN